MMKLDTAFLLTCDSSYPFLLHILLLSQQFCNTNWAGKEGQSVKIVSHYCAVHSGHSAVHCSDCAMNSGKKSEEPTNLDFSQISFRKINIIFPLWENSCLTVNVRNSDQNIGFVP